MKLNGDLVFLGSGQVKGLRLENLATDPESPALGRLWFNSTTKMVKFNDGTDVLAFATGGALADYLALAGGTLAGALTLSGAPTEDLHASTKLYVDNGLSGKQDSLGYTPVNKAGDTMSGALNFGGSYKILGLANPTNSDDAATKAYVDSSLAGLDFQPDILDIQVDATLDPGASPATGARYVITASTALHANFGTIAGLGDGDIVEYDGDNFVVAYDVSVRGSGAIAWSTNGNSFVYWDGTTWSMFGGFAGVTAGVGLVKDGNTMDVNLGAGITALPEDEVGIHLYTNSGLILTENGTDASTATGAALQIHLNGTTLAKDASGVKVADGGITATQLNASVAGSGLSGGAGTALSVNVGTGLSITEGDVVFSETYGDARYATLSGATFTGAVILNADPSADLGAATKQYVDAVSTKLNNSHFIYDGSLANQTSHTVTHNIGQKYCNVTVVDTSDQVIIPDTITFDTANQLTVTFTSAQECRVIVTGVA